MATCWRRFAEWAGAGVFELLQEVLLDELGETGALDWSRVTVDSFSLRAVRGDLTGANPVDRAKSGSKPTRPTTTPLPQLPGQAGIKVRIARRGIESSTRLGRHLESRAQDRLAGRLPAAAGAL